MLRCVNCQNDILTLIHEHGTVEQILLFQPPYFPFPLFFLLFSYSDGDLTLIYPDGLKCSSGFERMTIINFQCNKTACESTCFCFLTDAEILGTTWQ